MMWKEFSCHLIGGRRLFALGNKRKAFLLRMTTAQRSGSCKLIGGRREDLRHHARPDQIRNSRLSGRCSLASIVITRRIVLSIMITIGQLRIDWAGRVEILVYDQNRFIISRIKKRFKEVKNPYQRRRVIAVVGHQHTTGMCSRHAPIKQMGYKPVYLFG
jgi:hypothetical protein